MFGMTNWQTTISSIPAMFGAAMNIYSSIKGGITPDAEQWGILGTALSTILIGINAKDKNVTGGSIPQTVEAKARAASAPLPASEVK